MAFAGNDLVNFIGVPITGFQTYQAHQQWLDSGASGSFSLGFLEEAVAAPPLLLALAGGIMMLTFGSAERRVRSPIPQWILAGKWPERTIPTSLAEPRHRWRFHEDLGRPSPHFAFHLGRWNESSVSTP